MRTSIACIVAAAFIAIAPLNSPPAAARQIADQRLPKCLDIKEPKCACKDKGCADRSSISQKKSDSNRKKSGVRLPAKEGI